MPFKQPPVSVGQSVLWYPPGKDEAPCPALVQHTTAEQSVCLSVLPREFSGFDTTKISVMHKDDPRHSDDKEPKRRYGSWKYTDHDELIMKKLGLWEAENKKPPKISKKKPAKVSQPDEEQVPA